MTRVDRRGFLKGMGTVAAKGALVSGTFGLTSSRCPSRSGPSNPADADIGACAAEINLLRKR